MSTLDTAFAETLERKLTRIYVALAMTRNVAERGVYKQATIEASRSLLTLIDVASGMLEEILDTDSEAFDEVSKTCEPEMVM